MTKVAHRPSRTDGGRISLVASGADVSRRIRSFPRRSPRGALHVIQDKDPVGRAVGQAGGGSRSQVPQQAYVNGRLKGDSKLSGTPGSAILI